MFEYIIALAIILRAYNWFSIFLIRRRNKGPVTLREGMHPFFKKRKGKKVALLIHCFTGSPKEFRQMGEYLAKKGISVYAPLLPGHGTSPEQLVFTKADQWLTFLKEQIKLLEEEFAEIYVVGNSLGGNMALLLSHESEKIKGVVTLGTAMSYPNQTIIKMLLPIARRVKVFQKKRYKSEFQRKLIQEEGYAYGSVPLHSVHQGGKILTQSRKKIKEVDTPILIMHTPNDPYTGSNSHNFIYDHVSSDDKEMFSVPDSYHVFIIDKNAPLVNKKILEFIKSH